MAQNTTIYCLPHQWTQLTDADISAITFQVGALIYGGGVKIKCTTDATAPTDTDGAIRYLGGQGEIAVSLADLAPGIASPVRVWAYPDAYPAEVMVGHA